MIIANETTLTPFRLGHLRNSQIQLCVILLNSINIIPLKYRKIFGNQAFLPWKCSLPHLLCGFQSSKKTLIGLFYSGTAQGNKQGKST